MDAIQYVDESSSFTIEDNHRARVLIEQSRPVPGVVCFEIPGEWLSESLAQYKSPSHTENQNGQRSKTRRP